MISLVHRCLYWDTRTCPVPCITPEQKSAWIPNSGSTSSLRITWRVTRKSCKSTKDCGRSDMLEPQSSSFEEASRGAGWSCAPRRGGKFCLGSKTKGLTVQTCFGLFACFGARCSRFVCVWGGGGGMSLFIALSFPFFLLSFFFWGGGPCFLCLAGAGGVFAYPPSH